ncbi:hypothetical protein KJ953_02185 [Patescibacteria group bacterium]|nr:hypothetical protein [Patescibacteria group bacterium]MBU1256849.1 hypothetical protein [Patescibacteria group bacterium]MBU1457869.1 hypothetical protein [Patescibacteria group bacterium]
MNSLSTYPDNKEYQDLLDISSGVGRALVNADRRVQLKMPSVIVDMLDGEFPGINRSELLTQMATEILIRKKRMSDPTLEGWVSEEQYDLDRMWTYLTEREKKNV